MSKENDRARNELVDEIKKLQKRLKKLTINSNAYKDLKKYLNYLISELNDYDKFRGYK